MSNEDVAHNSSRHYFSKSTKVEASAQTVAAIEISGQAMAGRSASLPQMTLSLEDIPRADLSEPFKQYTVSALRWCISRPLNFNLSQNKLKSTSINDRQVCVFMSHSAKLSNGGEFGTNRLTLPAQHLFCLSF